jgi:hypothetical protein
MAIGLGKIFFSQVLVHVRNRLISKVCALGSSSHEQVQNLAFMTAYIDGIAIGPTHMFDHLFGKAVILLIFGNRDGYRFNQFFNCFFQEFVLRRKILKKVALVSIFITNFAGNIAVKGLVSKKRAVLN